MQKEHFVSGYIISPIWNVIARRNKLYDTKVSLIITLCTYIINYMNFRNRGFNPNALDFKGLYVGSIDGHVFKLYNWYPILNWDFQTLWFGIINHSYTPRTVHEWCSQSELRIVKIRKSSARALFLYNIIALRTLNASVSVAYGAFTRAKFCLAILDKIMHLRFDFDACPVHSPFWFVHLTHQNLSTRALFCLNSLSKVNTQLLIYKCGILVWGW